MAGTAGTQNDDLTADVVVVDDDGATEVDFFEHLRQNGHRYSFFHLVHQLEQQFPEAPLVGGQGPAAREILHFRPSLSLAFQTGDIARIVVEEDANPDDEMPRIEVVCNFLGIYGASSPLPSYLTEDLLAFEDDNTLPRRFLDLFNHRLYALLYRVWKKYRCLAGDVPKRDWASRRLQILLGIDTVRPGGDDLSPASFMRFADILGQRPISAAAMETAVQRLLPGMPVAIEPCIASHSPIPSDQLTRLGRANSSLGRDCWAGRLVADRSTTFGITIGPVGYDDFRRLLPEGDLNPVLAALVALLNRDHLACQVHLSVASCEVPPLRLGHQRFGLGWNARLAGVPRARSVFHHVTYRLDDHHG